MVVRTKRRYGIILINKIAGKLYVLRRINYSLWDMLNNIDSENNNNTELAMYPGVERLLEFPKGVREKKESSIGCAVREFFEETSIKINLDEVEIVTEVNQQYIGGNNRHYSVLYYVFHIDTNSTLDTVILNIDTSAVLGDKFNILVWTKWIYIRSYFVSSNFMSVVDTLDSVFSLCV